METQTNKNIEENRGKSEKSSSWQACQLITAYKLWQMTTAGGRLGGNDCCNGEVWGVLCHNTRMEYEYV